VDQGGQGRREVDAERAGGQLPLPRPSGGRAGLGVARRAGVRGRRRLDVAAGSAQAVNGGNEACGA